MTYTSHLQHPYDINDHTRNTGSVVFYPAGRYLERSPVQKLPVMPKDPSLWVAADAQQEMSTVPG